MAKKLTIIIFNSSKITRCRCTGPLLRTILKKKKKKGETGSPFAILAGLYFFFFKEHEEVESFQCQSKTRLKQALANKKDARWVSMRVLLPTKIWVKCE